MKTDRVNISIDNMKPWREEHWNAIRDSYQNAPYFTKYAPFFEEVYSKEWKMIVDLDEYIIRGMLDFFDIKKEILRTSKLKTEGKKTDLLIDICRKTHADGYLSGTGGAHTYVQEESLVRLYFSR